MLRDLPFSTMENTIGYGTFPTEYGIAKVTTGEMFAYVLWKSIAAARRVLSKLHKGNSAEAHHLIDSIIGLLYVLEYYL